MRRRLVVGLAGLAVLSTAALTLATCGPPVQPRWVAPSSSAGTGPGIATRTGPFRAGPVAPPGQRATWPVE